MQHPVYFLYMKTMDGPFKVNSNNEVELPYYDVIVKVPLTAFEALSIKVIVDEEGISDV